METNKLQIMQEAKDRFVMACEEIQDIKIINDFGQAFVAVNVVNSLRKALTDEIMNAVFMPIMNTKIGFLTDCPQIKNGQVVKKAYEVSVVRDAIIDGVLMGLTPTNNHMNIIAGRAYPTKEGYTFLLKKLNVKYILDVSYDKGSNVNFAEIPVKINYEYLGQKSSFSIVATVKKDTYSSHDALRGKAERRAKKALYEYLTGSDFGEAEDTVDISHEEVIDKKKEAMKASQNTAPTLL